MNNYIRHFILALCTFLLCPAVSCKKENGASLPKYGEDVVFTANTAGSQAEAKAQYSGTITTGEDGRKKEYILWESGDVLRIYCAECSAPTTETYGGRDHWSDYVVDRESASTQASISVKPGQVGLRWGASDTQHTFYSVFPSPSTAGKSADVFFSKGKNLVGNIPQIQLIDGDLISETIDEKTITTAKPDLSGMYMVGRTSVTPNNLPEDKSVLINYIPITTVLEFTITKGTDTEDEIEYVALESAGHHLYGTFGADLENWTPSTSGAYTYPVCTDLTSVSDGSTKSRVRIDFSGESAGDVTISKAKSLKFTFLLLPVTPTGTVTDVDDLTFIIKKKGVTKTLTTKLSYSSGEGISFPTHKKSYISGVFVPDGAQWVINYAPVVTPWVEVEGDSAEIK